MKKATLAVLLSSLVAMGCTSGSDSGSASGGATGTDPGEAQRAVGVTDDTIKIGVTYVDLAKIRDVTDIDHGDYEASYRAILDDINDRGGINGRKLEYVFAPINPIDSATTDASCLKLTQDEKVFAVVGFFLADAVLCYVDTHATMTIGGEMTAQRIARAKAPWYTYDISEDLQTDAVRTLATSGIAKGKLAVFALATDQALLKETIEPELRQAGITPVEVAVNDAPLNDEAAADDQTKLILERFKASGATKILVVGNSPQTLLTNLAETSYRPELLFAGTSTAKGFAYSSAATPEALEALEGAVAVDVYGPEPTAWWETESSRDCIARVEKGGVDVPTPPEVAEPGRKAQEVSAWYACRSVDLFAALIEAAGRDLSYGSVRAAAKKGVDAPWAGSPVDYRYGEPPHADGDPPLYLFDWNQEKRAFLARSTDPL